MFASFLIWMYTYGILHALEHISNHSLLFISILNTPAVSTQALLQTIIKKDSNSLYLYLYNYELELSISFFK